MRARWNQDIPELYDESTGETVQSFAPVLFYDEFWRLSEEVWTSYTENGSATLLTDGLHGVRLSISGTDGADRVAVSWNGSRQFRLDKGLIFESRIRPQLLPTGNVVMVVGLCGAFNVAVDSIAESIWFRLDGGSGAVTVESDDTVHETSKVATGVTLTTTQWATVKIDCTDTSNIKFYIDGDRVAESTVFNMSQVTTLTLQPMLYSSKASGTSFGNLDIDYVRIWQGR